MTTDTIQLTVPARVREAGVGLADQASAQCPPVKIQDAAVLLNVNMSRFHVWRKTSTAAVEIGADEEGNVTSKEALAVNKEILKCDELRLIQRLDDEVRRYLYSRCLPSVFKRGVYLLPLGLLEEVMGRLAEFEATRAALVEAFLLVYEREAAAAKVRLGNVYDRADYPPVEAVKGLFVFETQLIEMSVPATLETVRGDLYRKELQKAQEMWSRSQSVITATLYEEFRKLVTRLSVKLQDRTDGKRQIFRDSTVSNLQEWLQVFDARNLTDDASIVELVETARRLIAGVDPETIRASDRVRADLARRFEELGGAIEQRIDELPDRAISFE